VLQLIDTKINFPREDRIIIIIIIIISSRISIIIHPSDLDAITVSVKYVYVYSGITWAIAFYGFVSAADRSTANT
jgi:hypothetical protein